MKKVIKSQYKTSIDTVVTIGVYNLDELEKSDDKKSKRMLKKYHRQCADGGEEITTAIAEMLICKYSDGEANKEINLGLFRSEKTVHVRPNMVKKEY